MMKTQLLFFLFFVYWNVYVMCQGPFCYIYVEYDIWWIMLKKIIINDCTVILILFNKKRKPSQFLFQSFERRSKPLDLKKNKEDNSFF